MDKDAFELAKRKILRDERVKQGIGTLSEKTLHAILKLYYGPDPDMHEIPIENFWADIYTGDKIIEIQTHNLGKLRPKLEVFLKDYKVSVVYPIPRETYMIYIDSETGEHSAKRKSPKKGNIYDAFIELWRIHMYLLNPNLEIRILLLDVEEYRLKTKRVKRGRPVTQRYDRIPIEVCEEVVIECVEDYKMFIPIELGDEFTSTEFAKAAHISRDLAQSFLSLMNKIGVVERVSRSRAGYLYRVGDGVAS